MSIDAGSGIISGTVASSAGTSPYSVTVTASDGALSQSFTWTVAHLAISNPGNQTNREGSSISLQLSAHDSDGDTLTYSATGLPAGLSVNSSTGLISGTVSGTARGSSPYTVTVTAADVTHNASQTFTWVVTPHVVMVNPGNQSNADSDAVSLPPGLSINSSTGVVSGTLSSTADSGSPYTTTVTASDGTYSNTQTFTWTVSHVLVVNPGTQTNTDGDTVSLRISARDRDGERLYYNASGLPPGFSFNHSTGLISGHYLHRRHQQPLCCHGLGLGPRQESARQRALMDLRRRLTNEGTKIFNNFKTAQVVKSLRRKWLAQQEADSGPSIQEDCPAALTHKGMSEASRGKNPPC